MVEIPFELIEKIVCSLPNQDKAQCLLVSKRWYASLYRVLVHTVVIEHRGQLKQFLRIISMYDDLVGPYVRQLHIKNRVGLTKEEFQLLGRYCPHMEVFQFLEWRHYKPPALSKFKNIKQIPKVYDLGKGEKALRETGKTLTHLDLGARIVRDLVLQNWLIPFFCYSTNLTHLTLDGFYNPTTRVGQLEFSCVTWKMLHLVCSHLISIEIHTVCLTVTASELDIMKLTMHNDSLSINPQMKHLSLRNLSIDDPVWLIWLAKIYPNLTVLDLRFDLNAFVNFDDTIQKLDREATRDAFAAMAHHVDHLHTLVLESVKASHFPGQQFFATLEQRKVRLEKLTLRYNTDIFLSIKGLDGDVLNAVVDGQYSTIKALDLDLWIHAHVDLSALLDPLSICHRLVELKLSSDDFKKFNFNPVPIDIILDHCHHLTRLSLARCALTINDKHSADYYHPLKKIVIAVGRVSKQLFRYLGARCPDLTHMEILTCSWMPREMEMRIDMPSHHFDFLRISDLNKIYVPRLEGNLGSGTSPNLFAVTQFTLVKKRIERYTKRLPEYEPCYPHLASWYHLYEVTDGRLRYPPSALRRLRLEEVKSLEYMADYYTENYHRDQMGVNGFMVDRYLPKKDWRDDIQFGYIHVRCSSIRRMQYNYNEIKWPKQEPVGDDLEDAS
ncbi:hypothetical protein MAM1_0007d00841 [Mucor ambiguus]|uniref:F-box domain-containing protein n=1 Tax=Mucor ambiguus TaxID=91626 RepID=A0A0C9MHG3_9FUNG|nr:hypothetical protein MAM1_0007d00841 [Mucor ambiguus]